VTISGVSGAMIDKGNHRHFMLKEIYEQPVVVAQTLRSYLRRMENQVALPDMNFDLGALSALPSSPAAPVTMPVWSPNTGSNNLPVSRSISMSQASFATASLCWSRAGWRCSSASRARPPIRWRHCAMRGPKARSSPVVVNVPTSSMAREADLLAADPCRAGDRRGLDQGLHLPARRAGRARRQSGASQWPPQPRTRGGIVWHLSEAPAAMNEALSHDAEIERMAHLIAPARDVLYLGRGPDYPMALEGALKLKEISYIHCRGLAAAR